MSGPKGFELKYILNSVWLCREEIASLMERLNSFGEEICAGGFKTAAPTACCLENFDALFDEAKEIAARSQGIDGVDIYKRRAEAESLLAEMKQITFSALEMKKNIFHKILKLRCELVEKVKNIENIKRSIASAHLSCAINVDGAKIAEAGKKLLEISAVEINACPAVEYAGFNYREIASFEDELAEAETELKKRRLHAVEYIESLRRESVDESLKGVEIKKYETAGDLFEKNKKSASDEVNESEMLEKTVSIISKFSVLNGGRKVQELLAGHDAIGREEDPQRRGLLRAGFELYCERLLKDEATAAKTLEEITLIQSKLESLAPQKAFLLSAEAKKAAEEEDRPRLEKIKASAAAVLEEELAAAAGSRMGEIIKSAFREMGYETEEEFGTLLVKNQKMFISKPSMKNYMVQVVSNSHGRMLQMQIVRLAGGGESAETLMRHATRDIEAETEFCADYEEMLKKLSSQGIEVDHKMRMKPGEVKVKTIKAPDRRQCRPDESAGEEKKARKL